MIGTRLGPYEITARLGEGGMGEVFRATDSNLRREVAIKLLPAAFTADADRLARFEREAQLLAQLNHPNIAQIHGFERSGETRALVMELVEGATLDERLAHGAMPVVESLAIARQIAEALEAAHEKGIVHRDLKPQNVKVTHDGRVKVLDFGLAKAMDPGSGAASSADPSRSPTLMHSPTLTAVPGTALGVILGTAAYMAPEQARGGMVDKRADIWAFGVVLYEMLSGSSLFAGPTVSDTLAGVLKTEIDWKALPAETPAAIRRLLRRLLERNPKNRLHDIADARIVLDEVAAGRFDEAAAAVGPSPVSAPPRSAAARALPWIAGLVAGAALLALIDRTWLAPKPVEPPALVSLTYSGEDSNPAASPDGKTIAFMSGRDGKLRIWLKQLATGEEVALTSGPVDLFPRFSPDGSTLLFLRGTQPPYDLFRIPAVGGEPRRVASGVSSSAAWSPDGKRIALTRSSTPANNPDILVSITAEGDDEREIARSAELLYFGLRWSPDERTIGARTNLRTNFAARQAVVEVDVASGEHRTLHELGGGAIVNGWDWNGRDGLLVAESATQSGRGGVLLRSVMRGSGSPVTLLSLTRPSGWLDIVAPGSVIIDQASRTRSLLEQPIAGSGTPGAAPASAPRWLTRGASVDRQPVYSPDGKRVAFNSDRGGNLDIWEMELASGSVRRLTTSASDDWDPAWSADGRRLVWSSNRSGNFEIWIADSDGSGARKVTSDGVDAENPTMTPDGRWIVYTSGNPAQAGIWRIGADGSDAGQIVAGPLSVTQLSLDGRWVSAVDSSRGTLRIFAVADGSEIATLDTGTFEAPGIQVGRSRWLPGSTPTIVWMDYDTKASASCLIAQEVVPGRDTSSTRRTLAASTPDALLESFAISPDGAHLMTAVDQSQTDLLLIDGLAGVAP